MGFSGVRSNGLPDVNCFMDQLGEGDFKGAAVQVGNQVDGVLSLKVDDEGGTWGWEDIGYVQLLSRLSPFQFQRD